MTDRLTSYGDLATVLADLPRLLRAERRRRQLSLRDAAAELGVSNSTVHRIESGEDYVASGALAILRWLAGDTAPAGPAPTHVLIVHVRRWEMAHPDSCSVHAEACPVYRAAEQDLVDVTLPEGRYEVEASDEGRLQIYDRLDTELRAAARARGDRIDAPPAEG